VQRPRCCCISNTRLPLSLRVPATDPLVRSRSCSPGLHLDGRHGHGAWTHWSEAALTWRPSGGGQALTRRHWTRGWTRTTGLLAHTSGVLCVASGCLAVCWLRFSAQGGHVVPVQYSMQCVLVYSRVERLGVTNRPKRCGRKYSISGDSVVQRCHGLTEHALRLTHGHGRPAR
jgi:hypothetical protein